VEPLDGTPDLFVLAAVVSKRGLETRVSECAPGKMRLATRREQAGREGPTQIVGRAVRDPSPTLASWVVPGAKQSGEITEEPPSPRATLAQARGWGRSRTTRYSRACPGLPGVPRGVRGVPRRASRYLTAAELKQGVRAATADSGSHKASELGPYVDEGFDAFLRELGDREFKRGFCAVR
jgi:hypothetical protein